MTDKRPRQNTGNHPDPLAETFLITAAQLEELTTHAANASSGACHGSTTREKAAWKLFDSVVENVKAQEAPHLTADFTRSLPGGKLDDSTYEAIESALDKVGAPMHGEDGRWLALAERIVAQDGAYGRMILALNAQLTEQFEIGTKYCGLWDAAYTALDSVHRFARSDGQRTFDDCILDLERIDDICRWVLSRPTSAPDAPPLQPTPINGESR